MPGFFGEPQALFSMNQPTTLDMESIGWLETFMHQYKGTFIVISHDRHFFNSVCTHIADIDYETIIPIQATTTKWCCKNAVRERAELDPRARKEDCSVTENSYPALVLVLYEPGEARIREMESIAASGDEKI